jgi:hypothetical protein
MLGLETIYILGFAATTVLVAFGHFGFGRGPLCHELGLEDVRFLAFTLLWFLALPGWFVYRLTTRHRHG